MTSNCHNFSLGDPQEASHFNKLCFSDYPAVIVTNCKKLASHVTSHCHKLSPSGPQMASDCSKLYCSDLLCNHSSSQTVTQWHPNCPIIVTKCHPATSKSPLIDTNSHPATPKGLLIVTNFHSVTPKWPLIVTNCIPVTSHVYSFCHKLSPRHPKGTTNCPNCHTVSRNWNLVYTNCGSNDYKVNFKGNKLSTIRPSLFSFHKLSAASPKEPISVTNCHSLTQQLASNRRIMSSMFTQSTSNCHKLSPSEPWVYCDSHKL